MVLVCLPFDALWQHLPSYLGFSYLGLGASLHGCSSKAQLLLFILEEGYLLTAALMDRAEAWPPVRSNPSPKVRGGNQECQTASVQEWRRGATPPQRPGAVAERSYPMPKVRGSGRKKQPQVQGVAAAWAQEGPERS